MTRMSLEEAFPGTVDVQERQPKNADGFWTKVPLLEEVQREDIGFNVILDSEWVDGISIDLSDHHVSDGNGRAFHIHTEAHLDWDAVRRLHAFLEALISVRGTVE